MGVDLAVGGTGGNGGDAPDLAGDNGGVADLAAPGDMAVIQDLAPIPDLSPIPDLAPACAPPSGSACVVYPQCGCTSTQACDITSTSGNAVCVAPGTTPDWNGCSGSGQCKKGSSCVHGVCTPFCASLGAPSADCAGGNAECYQLQDPSKNPPTDIPNDKVCSNNCDPTNPQNANGFSPCGPNVNCYPDSDHYAWCLGPTTSSGTQGTDCTNAVTLGADPTLCAIGYYCVGASIGGTCYKMCHKAKTGECPGSTSCTSFSTKQYAGSAEIGYCK